MRRFSSLLVFVFLVVVFSPSVQAAETCASLTAKHAEQKKIFDGKIEAAKKLEEPERTVLLTELSSSPKFAKMIEMSLERDRVCEAQALVQKRELILSYAKLLLSAAPICTSIEANDYDDKNDPEELEDACDELEPSDGWKEFSEALARPAK